MSTWRRWRSLSWADQRLVVRAAGLLVVVRLGLWILPFGTLRRILARATRTEADARPPSGPAEPAHVGWAVAAAARRMPAMTCLVQALVADALLRRAGRLPELTIGARRTTTGRVEPRDAHAWVTCDGRVIVGDLPDLNLYAPLTTLGRS